MQEVYNTEKGGLWIGDDSDYYKAKEKGWYIISACKDGPHGHRAMLDYKEHGAPKGKEYLWAVRGKHLTLNLVDAPDPNFISDEAVDVALAFIHSHINDANILLHCNQGQSRSPSIAMLFLRSINDLPDQFRAGYRVFKTLYPVYEPGIGMEQYTKTKYHTFKGTNG